MSGMVGNVERNFGLVSERSEKRMSDNAVNEQLGPQIHSDWAVQEQLGSVLCQL